METIARKSNQTFLVAGLTGISGSATTFSTAAAGVTYSVGGKIYHKAQESGGTTPTVDIVTGAAFPALSPNQGTVWVFGYDSGGTIRLAQGSIEALDSAGNFWRAPQFPILPDTVTAISYVVAKYGSTGVATFTVGTDNWDTTGMTYSVKDVSELPTRPQVS
jgi:hypothetical protein